MSSTDETTWEDAPQSEAISSDRVFVRVLNLPTTNLGQARAAVRLQLDRLSPVPPEGAVFDLVAMGPSVGGASYAVGILAMAHLLEAMQRYPAAARFAVDARANGQPVTFQFANVGYRSSKVARWLSTMPPLAAGFVSIGLVLAGLHQRLAAETHALEANTDAQRRLLAAQARQAQERQSSQAEWMATTTDLASLVPCALSALEVNGAAPPPVSALETSGARLRITFASTPSNAYRLTVARQPGVTWEGDARQARVLDIGPESCP